MGIDPREGTLLTVVAMRVRAGWSAEKALEGLDFHDPFVSEIAQGLVGHPVSEAAKAQARRIGAWAGVPGFTAP